MPTVCRFTVLVVGQPPWQTQPGHPSVGTGQPIVSPID